ncbi:unnamed protein product [Macrosiphum euphorbiae]|uniref:Uncharacterized protein n=1 Tax=Macrosiphum euphorbiae TaxID=13131 RepID=A0AAV0WX71_9HEMI|nr:unnamed protein product [Macrosiphum euphorbiae]
MNYNVVHGKATNNSELYKIEILLNSNIFVEKPHLPRSPRQYVCQYYGHTRKYCYHDPQCVRCEENHFSNSCTKSLDSPARCPLCNSSLTQPSEKVATTLKYLNVLILQLGEILLYLLLYL